MQGGANSKVIHKFAVLRRESLYRGHGGKARDIVADFVASNPGATAPTC